jgi:hypothetical protein
LDVELERGDVRVALGLVSPVFKVWRVAFEFARRRLAIDGRRFQLFRLFAVA